MNTSCKGNGGVSRCVVNFLHQNSHVGEFGCGNPTKSFLPLSNLCKKEARDRSCGRNSVVYSMSSGQIKSRVKAAAGDKGEGLTYKDSGVDIDAGSELVRRIAKMAPGIGGFGGLFPLGDSYLVAGTDGVGTKLKLAFETGIHETIGIDLVAMSVNDIVTSGAKPLFFLDYFATSRLDVDLAEKVIKGIVDGCQQSDCALLGGETAEMPDFYAEGEYDLSGFAVGIVKKESIIDGKDIKVGDVLIGLPSSGVHSNGFSLVRRVFERSGLSLKDNLPGSSIHLGEALMAPTVIYVKQVLDIISKGGVKGIAHITGGGFTDNIPRVFPQGLGASIYKDSWVVPPVFKWIQEAGKIEDVEMRRTFNMGIGMVLVVDQEAALRILEAEHGANKAFRIGEVIKGVASNVKLLLKLIQDHKNACDKDKNDSRRMLRVATMMTILDGVRSRIQKCQSFGNKTSEAELRRCNTDVRRNSIPRDRKNGNEPLDDEKERLKRELNSSLATQKSLSVMCSGLGKEREIMATQLSLKVHELSEMEDLINELKKQNERLLDKVRECASEHKEKRLFNGVGRGESQGNVALQERNKELSEQLLKSLEGYRSIKRKLREAQEENMVMHSTIDEMGAKVITSIEKVRGFKERISLSSSDDVPDDIREEIVALEGMFHYFQECVKLKGLA